MPTNFAALLYLCSSVRLLLSSALCVCLVRSVVVLSRSQEEADWKKRKDVEAREIAVQLAMQSSPAPPQPTPIAAAAPASPGIGRSVTITAVSSTVQSPSLVSGAKFFCYVVISVVCCTLTYLSSPPQHQRPRQRHQIAAVSIGCLLCP